MIFVCYFVKNLIYAYIFFLETKFNCINHLLFFLDKSTVLDVSNKNTTTCEEDNSSKHFFI